MNQANIAYKFKKQYEQSHQLILECIKQKALDVTKKEELISAGVEDTSEAHNMIKSEEPCITTDIFNLSEVEVESVSIEAIFEDLDSHSNSCENEKPKIKNISMVDENKIARKCSECKYVFQTAHAFFNHACNRDNLERKLCPICGKSISKSHYNKHLYMHSGRRDYICHICNKAYNASGSLKFHMAKHTGEKPYLCSLCGKRFIQPTALKYHMRFHNNERRYKCNFCDKSFVMQCHLVAHERVHTGLKPFTCEICSKSFTRKVELKTHTYFHTGEKPFKCRFCDKKFVRKTHITLHEMIHSGKRPHECEICGKGFIQRQPLQLHLKMHERRQSGDKEEEHCEEREDYCEDKKVDDGTTEEN